MRKYVFINGKLILESRANIPVNDRGFLYGDGLFETIRGYNGHIFMLDAHLKRLFSSLKVLRYNINFDKSYIIHSLQKTLKRNKLDKNDTYIKIIVTRGIYGGKLYFESASRANLIMITRRLRPYPLEYYKNGIKVISSSIKRGSFNNKLYCHKLLNYFESIFAKNEAHLSNAQEAIFLTRDHLVLEGATSNIFYVKNNIIYTPPLTQNILPGITRQAVIEICEKNRLKLKQRKVHYFDIIDADEVFITNSIMEIMPVKEIDKYRIRGKVPGLYTEKLIELYRNKIYSEEIT